MSVSPPFVVTGTGRSGTGYAAALLTAAGHSCGHEELFTVRTQGVPQFGRRQGDSSWLAAPFLASLPAGSVILHQVRNPLEVLRSFLGIRLFDDTFRLPATMRLKRRAFLLRESLLELAPSRPAGERPPSRADFVNFVRRYTPEVFAYDEQLTRCMAHWVSWNHLVATLARAPGLRYLRYRLEDIDLARLVHIDHELGGDGDETRLQRALESVPPHLNSRQRADDVRWESIPPSPLRDDFLQLALDYGYRL